ncbi:MAG: 16S rRNA (adenine1518-N6/adenine1519-N6)-dimethyltransferase [Pelagibacterales bacterium]|nr:16S rRNA (adenine1518-N6/adenine1519-N6)-dimethyltransferase [Pelagibacterales bacterium]
MIKLKKSLGQNFLIDKNIIRKIVGQVSINKKNVLEIGPGSGNLTQEIINYNVNNLLLVEKDNNLSDILDTKFKNLNKFKVINKDILKTDIEKLILNDTVIYGNLPYNISTQILIKLIKFEKWLPKYKTLVLMFQKEVGERIIAKHNTQKFGRLTIMANYRLKVINHFNVSKNCFFPKPKVDSIVIVFKPIKNNFNIKNINNLEKITQMFFSNRRKMVNKVFIKLFNNYKQYLKKININLTHRPSQLKSEDFYKITECFESSLDELNKEI